MLYYIVDLQEFMDDRGSATAFAPVSCEKHVQHTLGALDRRFDYHVEPIADTQHECDTIEQEDEDTFCCICEEYGYEDKQGEN